MSSRELKALTSQLRGRREGERRNLPSLLTEYLSPPFTCFFPPLGFVVTPRGGEGTPKILYREDPPGVQPLVLLHIIIF